MLFTISGFSGLIYESIWAHYLKLLLGHAAYAQTLVLLIFMGGMTIGAFVVARFTTKIQNPLLIYALAEGIIGILAITFHQYFTGTMSVIFETIVPVLDSSASITLTKWTLAGLLILPQSILLGTTFPLMSASIIRISPEQSGKTLGALYFTNSIGAAMGVLAGVFIFIPSLGLPGAILIAGILNVLLALITWKISTVIGNHGTAATIEDKKQHVGEPSNKIQILLAVALLTGTASFFYEIAWIRMLSMVLSSTMQAFELMLSAFITGLAFGGLWINRRIKQISSPIKYVANVQILMGICALLTIPAYHYTFDFMSFIMGGLNKSENGYLFFTLVSHSIALAIMIPTTFLAGMTLPLITYSLINTTAGEKNIGKVYAFNTLGAIIGITLAVHLVMPYSGVKWLIEMGALIDISIGTAILFIFFAQKQKLERHHKTAIATAFGVSIIVAIFATPDFKKINSGVYRTGKSSQDDEIIFHRDGKTASISVSKSAAGDVIIKTNGKVDAKIAASHTEASMDETTMVITAAVPLALNKDIKTVANIGMGSGLTSHVLLGAAQIQQVDTIEIEPAIVEGAQLFGDTVSKVYHDPRSHIHYEDAKTFFSSRKSKYDLIVSEPSNPWVSGVASLFTDEFYTQIKTHLSDDGLFTQWLQLYETNFKILSSIFVALDNNFEDYAVFNTDDANIIIVASKKPRSWKIDRWIFKEPGLANNLKRVNISNEYDLEYRRIGDKKTLRAFFSSFGAPVNSDYFPYVGLNAPKSRYLTESTVELTWLHLNPIPLLEITQKRPAANWDKSTPTNAFTRSEKEYFARNTATAILEKTDSPLMLPPGIEEAIRVLQLESSNCSDYSNREFLLTNSAYKLAVTINPFTSPKIADQVWKTLLNSKCYNRFPKNTKNWFNMFHAVGTRDYNSIINFSQSILETQNHLPQQGLDYALLAGLTASIALNDRKQASKFIEFSLKLSNWKSNPSLAARFLLSQLKQ